MRDLGGYGIAGLMYIFFKDEKLERLRYRDLHEQTLKNLPDITRAIDELAETIEKVHCEKK